LIQHPGVGTRGKARQEKDQRMIRQVRDSEKGMRQMTREQVRKNYRMFETALSRYCSTMTTIQAEYE
jgi:hypothetical protein